MADNLTLYMAQDRKVLVTEITPVGIDTVAKVIKRSQISSIHILNSTLFGMITKKDDLFTVVRSNLISVLGQGINLSCKLSNDNLRMLNSIKGNHNSLIFKKSPKRYLFTNGDCTALIIKIDSPTLVDLLPKPKNGIRRQTNKCKQISRAKGKSKFVDILIFDNQIGMVHFPDSNVLMSLNPISTGELMGKTPDLILRSNFFFHLMSDEALLEITLSDGIFWLRTEIQITQDISIEQFEPLKRIKK
ncbi:MAG: hypothetical protein PF503_25400 [Desulfobacula sp.]|jgi:hypothetical protein|nr:hypothetical protein [Desulfobacula sp.]